MDHKVRVAVVGLGWPGLRHLEAYLKHPNVEVRAVCDLNPILRESVQKEYGIEQGIADLTSLLALPELDAVSICTPNFLHQPMVCTALAANKHVLCEKPLAATLDQGELLAKAASESDRVCMVGFGRRYRDDSRAVKALVEQGELGQIYHAHAGWLRRRWNPSVRGWFLSKEHSGGGPLIDLGVHLLDLSLWLMGNPRAVTVSGSVSRHFTSKLEGDPPADVEDLATAYVRLDNGATLMLETSWVSYSGHADQTFCRLLGTQGGAKLELAPPNPVPPAELYFDRAGVPLVATPLLPGGNATQASFDREIAEFISAIQDNRAPASTVAQGLEILRILDAIYRSAEAGAEIRLEERRALP